VRVAVNTRLLIKNKLDGIGRFALETLKRITKNHPEVEFHFIFDRPFSEDFIFNDNIVPHVLTPPARHPILWYIWFQIQLPKLLTQINPDILFSPDGFIPINSKIRTITTIHDINFEHRPKDLPWAHSLFYRRFFKKYAQDSNQIITVSHFSKADIVKKYGVNAKKIHIVYNGVSSDFQKVSDKTKLEIQKKYSNGKDFFVFVGSLHKRKNIKNLLLSFNEYKKNNGSLKLIIVGEQKWMNREIKQIYQQMFYKEDVIFLGKISDSELVKILGSAHALCFISLFEGFGLPIIEAMKCSVPIITSNTSCMPEIVQNAGIIVDPYDQKDIAQAMTDMEKNENKRQKLIQNGNDLVKKFNWEKSANEIWKIMKLSINEPKII